MNKSLHLPSPTRGKFLSTVSLVTLMMISSLAYAQETIAEKSASAPHAKKASAKQKQKKTRAPATTTQQQAGVTEVPPVSVTTPATPLMDGSAEAGYRVEQSTAAGPFWGDLKMQDSPYTVNVVPSALIKNQQVYDIQNAIKYVPGVTPYSIQGSTGTQSYAIRGFLSSQTFEGMQGPNGSAGGTFNTAIEDKESIEILHGVSGFLYGVGSTQGGIINMALKRPTAIPYFSIQSGTNTGHNGFVHGDFGGPINIPGLTDGLLGYRLNVVGQGGDTQINNGAIKRSLISAAVDVHLAENLLVQFNGSYSNYHIWGGTPTYLASTDANNYLMAPANPAKLYTDPQLQKSSNLLIGGVKVTWKPDDILTFRTQYNYTQEYNSALNYLYNIVASNGNSTRGIIGNNFKGATNYTHAGYSFVDADFDLLGIHHKLTTGFSGYYSRGNNGSSLRSAPSAPTGSCNFYNQSSCNWTSSNAGGVYTPNQGYVTGNSFIENYMIGDEIKAFDERLIILAGANYAFTGSTGFNNTGVMTSHYNAAALTPTVALTYKLQPWLSVYASYQQSLAPGQIVGQSNGSGLAYTNAYSVIAPYIGTQWETGVKATVGENMLATLSFFQISQQNTFDQINADGTATLMVGGNQLGKGIEFTLTGKVWEDLALFGGLTLVDNRIQNNPNSPYQNGHLAAYVSPVTESLYAEYTIPYLAQAPWLHGLTLTGGFTYRSDFYTGLPSSYATEWSQTRVHGYALGDLGFRYATNLYDHPVTFRFTVTNVTNHAYWINSSNEGLPRTFLASAEFQW